MRSCCWTFGVILAVLLAGCSKKEETLPETPVSKAVENAISQIVSLVAPGGTAPSVICELKVADLTAPEFQKRLEAVDAENVTVWMPGETHWLVVGWNGTNRVSLATALETFAVDAENAASLPDVFASYVGMREDVMPAFESKLEGRVVPEWFLTKDVPPLPWLDADGVEADILKATLSEIRSMQVVRRLVLEGSMEARVAKDKKGEESAAEKWARAYLRNPRDPMLLERLDRLDRNAKGFLEVGKFLQAMKCYETIILVNPKNASAVHNFGICLKRLGKLDMAERVLKRADELAK